MFTFNVSSNKMPHVGPPLLDLTVPVHSLQGEVGMKESWVCLHDEFK